MAKKLMLGVQSDLPSENLSLETWLPYRLFIISARVGELMHDIHLPRFGISQASWRIIAVLGARPGLSARQLQNAAGLDQFSVSRALRQLLDLGYIERLTAARDKRRADVRLTSAGIKVFEDLSRVAMQIEQQLTEDVTEEERKALNVIIDKIDRASLVLK